MTDAAILRPATSQVEFTARPSLRAPCLTNHASGDVASHSGNSASGSSSAISVMANPMLSVIEIEAVLREKVRARYNDFHKDFLRYDRDNTASITRGKFRRVLESFCMAFTTEQFENIMNKVDINPNGTVRYVDFLDNFYGKDRPTHTVDIWVNKHCSNTLPRPTSPHEMNTDMTEKAVREQIQSNVKNVIKALRLYDYNRDGYIQRHELRKVMENFCFKMTDNQFDKLYQRYDFHHRGVINYKEFLTRLGVNVERLRKPSETTTGLPGVRQSLAAGVLKKPEDSAIKGMSIEQIEREFRRRMVKNYANLKRMFLTLDKHLDGFVSLEDLISVLNQFTFAMSNQLFHQLMGRIGIKASVKISWESFLERFQDPQSHSNGQTITMKPGHKFYPIRGVDETMDTIQIIRMIDNHVKNAYHSLKQAFLKFDRKRDGKITRRGMRKIIESFPIRLTNGQFGELFSILDPLQTNTISYHQFLELFEQKESISSHKWMHSCHHVSEKKQPTIMAWTTVEEMLKNGIEVYWRDIALALASCEPAGVDRLFPSELRRILEKFCLPMSDNHFENMISRLPTGRDADDRISFMELFNLLHVMVQPGDLDGVSTQILDASDLHALKKSKEQDVILDVMEKRSLDRTAGMSVAEVIMRIKDRISQRNHNMHSGFKVFDRSGTGKISKKDFRAVCESYGITMTDPKFKDVCAGLQFQHGFMMYEDFVANFEDLRDGGPPPDVERPVSHHVNPIRGDEKPLTAIEVESMLRTKLSENFEDLRSTFRKFYDNFSCRLGKSAFRRMLGVLMIRMSNEEFDILCDRLSISSKTMLTYKDFLDRFETREPIEAHKWLFSDHRVDKALPMGLMRAEDIHEVLTRKAHQQYSDLAKAFRSMASPNSGSISKKDLRQVLYKFMLPVSKPEFNRLWAWYDRGAKGFITHQDFLRRLTAEQFSPGDQEGESAVIIVSSQAKHRQHLDDMQERHNDNTLKQALNTSTMSVDTILQGLKDKIRDNYNEFRDAFKLCDRKNKGYLSVADMQRVLMVFHYIMDEDQLLELFDRLGILTNNSKLYYEDFLKAFEEGRKDSYPPPPEDPGMPRVEYEYLNPEQAEEKMRKCVVAQFDIVQAALQAFDKLNTHFIDVRDFRRLLDNFCFKMSDKQFKNFQGHLGVNRDNSMDYTYFLESFKRDAVPDPDPRKMISAIQKRLAESGPRALSTDEVHAALRELVTMRVVAITQAIATIDYAEIGVISRPDFFNVLNKQVIRLSEEQFERLWSTLKVNEFGNMDYKDFMDYYTSADSRGVPRSASIPALFSRPSTSDTGRRLHTSSGRPVTPLVNAESTEERVRYKINRYWKDIQKQCRNVDASSSGHVSQDEIRDILGQYNLGLSFDELFKLMLKYDLNNNSRFCYPEFIKNFVLHLGVGSRPASTSAVRVIPEPSMARLSRQKMMPPKLAATQESPSARAMDALTRVHATVSAHWKSLRRDFRAVDVACTGLLSPDDFRDVLRRNNVNLSEDEFDYVCGLYSRGDGYGGVGGPAYGAGAGGVAYNVFVKDFLKAAA